MPEPTKTPTMAEIEEALKAATTREWTVESGEGVDVRAPDGGSVCSMGHLRGRFGAHGRRTHAEVHANARLIAHAPTWLAHLLAEVRRLEGESKLHADRAEQVERRIREAAAHEVPEWLQALYRAAQKTGLADRLRLCDIDEMGRAMHELHSRRVAGLLESNRLLSAENSALRAQLSAADELEQDLRRELEAASARFNAESSRRNSIESTLQELMDELEQKLEAAERERDAWSDERLRYRRVLAEIMRNGRNMTGDAYERIAEEVLNAIAPPPPTWTRERPTEAGLYWLYQGGSEDGVEFGYFCQDVLCMTGGESHVPETFDWFYGPLSPPPLPGAEGGA